jgi:hypothetical protein
MIGSKTVFRAALVALALLSQAALAQSASWPGLTNGVGPYSGVLTVQDATAAAADGFNLTVQSVSDPAVLQTMAKLGIKYIDIRIWGIIRAHCKDQYGREGGGPKSCSFAPDERAAIVSEAAAHLAQVKGNPQVVAYWILDDYPGGDISATLQDLHALVHKANADDHTDKPTICGVGGSLDHRTDKNRSISPDRRYIERALTNISPAGCDVVAPYFYGSATENDPSWVDWSMSSLMPWFVGELRGRGYARAPLLPVVHAFSAGKRSGGTYYVHPRSQDIVAQARGYCGSGAIGLLFFTWQSTDAERSYLNDQDLRRGVLDGVAACKQMTLR